MRARFFRPALLAAALFAALPVLAQGAPPGSPQSDGKPAEQKAEQPTRPSTLDELYARLSAAKDEDEAKGVASLITRRLARSGSDTADLLLARAGEAMQGRDPALAVELLDRVTQLRPAWSEAWLRRAAAFLLLDDPSRAMTDLQEALVREPRHFTAWMVLAQIEMSSGDKARALAAYRRALKIHPHLPDAEKAVTRLSPDVDGRDL